MGESYSDVIYDWKCPKITLCLLQSRTTDHFYPLFPPFFPLEELENLLDMHLSQVKFELSLAPFLLTNL